MLKENKERFGLRKLSVGLASVMLGVVAMSSAHSTTVHADSVTDGDAQNVATQDVQNGANQKEEATKPTQVVKEVAPQVNKADAKAVTTTVRGGGTDLVKNSDKSVASDVNKENDVNVTGENANKAATASKNITDKKTVDAGNDIVNKTTDAVPKDNATQSFNVQKNNVNGISEKAVESNLIQDNEAQDSWADPNKYGFHYTEAGWTQLQQGTDYTAVAKDAHTTLIKTATNTELDKDNRMEVGDISEFGIDISATIDKGLIKQGNKILISSTAFMYKDGRHFNHDISANVGRINVISNGVKIGHIEAPYKQMSANSDESSFILAIDHTLDMTKDLDLHIHLSHVSAINWWNNQWLDVKGTTPDNPAYIELVTNKDTSYNYTLYADPNRKLKPYTPGNYNSAGTITGQDLNFGNIFAGDLYHNPNDAFTSQNASIVKVLKISRPQSIDGITIPNFKSQPINPYLDVWDWYPILAKDGFLEDLDLFNSQIYGKKLADSLSVQQVTEAAKASHFVYSLSTDGQSMLVGFDIPLDRTALGQITNRNPSVDDLVNMFKNYAKNTRTLCIDRVNESDDIINRSVNWIKLHNGEPSHLSFRLEGLPTDANQPNIQSISDVTLNSPHFPTNTASSIPKDDNINFDASVYKHLNVKFVDDDNNEKVINTDDFLTSTGTDLTYNIKDPQDPTFNSSTDIAFPKNFSLADKQLTTVHYGVVQDKNPDIIIHIKHLVKTVDGSINLDDYPDIKKALNGDSTRTFHITYPTGRQGSNPSTIVQSIHFIRSGKADFSTDTVDASTLTAWKPVASTAHGVTITNGVANFDSITLPRIAGYTAEIKQNPQNKMLYLVSFVANSVPSTPTDNKDQNTSKDNPDITTSKTSDDKHETISETPSVINDGSKPSPITHDWTINSIKSNDYLVSNGVDNYSLPMIGKTGLSIIKTNSNTLAFTYIKLNTPSDYVFTLIKRHKMYQLTVNKMENGKLTAIKTFRSHNYKDLMKELKKMAF